MKDGPPLPKEAGGDCRNTLHDARRRLNAGGSVTQCIADLKAGEASAAERLWQTYFQRLVGLARTKLGPRRANSPTKRTWP